MVKRDDPCRGVFEEVAKWNNTVECFPSWDALLEHEYVRSSGKVNMFTENVVQHCYDRGLLNAIEWLQRCKEARIHPSQLWEKAVEHYEKEHGPRAGWLTEDVRLGFEGLELDLEEAKLAGRMRELRKRQQKLKSKRGAP